MDKPTKPNHSFSPYFALGFVFIILGLAQKGMLAFVGVGAAFLYIGYKQSGKRNEQ